jgi:hypothetical protein
MSPALKANFEEKQYESAMTVELARGRGRVFSPGQVEERVLGYDAAALPRDEVATLFEQLAGVQLGPGTWLTPNWWLRCPQRPQPSATPSRFASLLLQYKRPAFHFSPRSKLFAAHQRAYFRIEFPRVQHRTMVRLDEALNDEAVVRYAAPCTVWRPELEQWQINSEVLEHTNFVSPRRMGLKHRAWTYTEAGRAGFRNEYREGDGPIESEGSEQLYDALLGERRASAGLAEHLSRLLIALSGEELERRLLAAVAEVEGFDRPYDLAGVLRLRLIGLSLFETGTHWWLFEL